MAFSGPKGVGPARVRLEQVPDEPERFTLLEGFHYDDGKGSEFEVTAAALGKTDLASVPWAFRWFVHSYGRHTLPALLHDCLVDAECARVANVGPIRAPNRSEADDIFLESLEVTGVPLIRRHLMWSTVTFHTRFNHAGWLAGLLMVVWVALAATGTILLFGGFIAGWGPAWLPWAAAVAPLPAAILWLGKWRAGIWFGYGVVFLMPAAVVVHLSYLPYWAAEKVLATTGKSTPPPSPKSF